MGTVSSTLTTPRRSPSLTNVTYADGKPYTRIIAFNSARTTIWAVRDAALVKSVDDGVTWTTVKSMFGTSPGEPLIGGRRLPNGELLLTTKVGGGKGGLWLSSGFGTNEATATWTKVLTVNSNDDKFYGAWGIDFAPKGHVREGLVVATAHGGQSSASTPADGGARYVYLSTDFGKTWKTIFDLIASRTGTNLHMHGVAYDWVDDRILACFGDGNTGAGAVSQIIACGDFADVATPTWQVLVDSGTTAMWQATKILPTATGVLLGGDGFPPGIWRLPRGGYRQLGQIQMVLPWGEATGAGYIAEDMVQSYPGGPILIGREWTKSGKQYQTAYISYDGVEFYSLWVNDTANANGWAFPAGPSSTGKVFIHVSGDTRFPSGQTMVTGQLMSGDAGPL